MSNHLTKIFDAWDGNAEAMAADIDELGVTVRQWRNRGDIPSRAWPKIIKAAAELRGNELRLEDFLRPEVVEDLPAHALTDKSEWPVGSADNEAETIGDGAEAEAGRPFAEGSAAAASPPTSSSTCPSCAASESRGTPHSSTGAFEAEAAE